MTPASTSNIHSGFKVIATIPCLNTEKTIDQVVKETLKYVDQVIIIDDGSTDNTAKIAKMAGALVVSHAVNKGYGASIQSGFAAARTNGADIVVTIDGDGQHNPAEIPGLLSLIINEGADVVIGSRFLPVPQNTDSTIQCQSSNRVPVYRKFGIKVITWLWNVGSLVKVSDSQSGFRAYGRGSIEKLNIKENGMSVSIEILEIIRKRKLIIKEAGITCSYADNNSTLSNKAFTHGIKVALSTIIFRMKIKQA